MWLADAGNTSDMLALWEFEHNVGQLFVAWTIRTIVGLHVFEPCCVTDDFINARVYWAYKGALEIFLLTYLLTYKTSRRLARLYTSDELM